MNIGKSRWYFDETWFVFDYLADLQKYGVPLDILRELSTGDEHITLDLIYRFCAWADLDAVQILAKYTIKEMEVNLYE